MGLKQYLWQIEQWRKTYGTPPVVFNADPTQITAGCLKCKKVRMRSARHHIGNDYFFANLLPDQFAYRYIQFHPDDVVRLCKRCHNDIHDYMHHEYTNMLQRLDKFHALPSLDAKIKWCNAWRELFIRMFHAWMELPSTTKREKQGGKRKRRKRVRKNRPNGRRTH